MRILGFTKKDWINYLTGLPKLEYHTFTTFRFTRGDKDWEVGEVVQVVYKPRQKGGGEYLGVAEIIKKEPRLGALNDLEAQIDGFADARSMEKWMIKTYGEARTWKPMNKLTLQWVALLSRIM